MPFAEGRDRAQIAQEIDQFNSVIQAVCRDKNIAYFDIIRLFLGKQQLRLCLSLKMAYIPAELCMPNGLILCCHFLMLVEMNRREKAQEFDRKDSLAHFKAAFFHQKMKSTSMEIPWEASAESERKHRHINARTMGEKFN